MLYEHAVLLSVPSPLTDVASTRSSMTIVYGMADVRVHPQQMIELHQALKLKGVPVELVLYPREPHGMRERQHQLDYMRRIVEAFNRYVRPQRPATCPARAPRSSACVARR